MQTTHRGALSHLSDAELMELAADDHPHAAGTLVDRHGDDVHRYVASLIRDTGYLTTSDIEPITGEVLHRMQRYAHSYDPSRRFQTWLFQIAKNEVRRELKKRAKLRDTEVQASANPNDLDDGSVMGFTTREAGRGLTCTDDKPTDILTEVKAEEIIDIAQRELPEHQWQPLRDYYLIGGYTWPELEDKYDVHRSTLSSRAKAGAEKIREIIGA